MKLVVVVVVEVSKRASYSQEVPQRAEIEHATSQRLGEARAFTVQRRRREGWITDADAGAQSQLDQLQLHKYL